MHQERLPTLSLEMRRYRPTRVDCGSIDRRSICSLGAGRLVSLLMVFCAARSFAAEVPPSRSFANLFEPEFITQIALSPDGEHLAYTVHENGVLSLVVMNPTQPEAKTV